MLAFLVFWLLQAPVPASSPTPSGAAVRECPINWNASVALKKKSRKPENKNSENGGACVELALPPLDVQEYLQSYARGQHWAVFEEHLSEDTWTFSLSLSRDELLAQTDEATRPTRVRWRSGVALVQIRSTPLSEGYTRSTVLVTFRGYGEGEDQFARQPEYWRLESNGSFEGTVICALRRILGDEVALRLDETLQAWIPR